MNPSGTTTPLWRQRVKLVLIAPLLMLIALCMALSEGWFEFWWELKSSAQDMKRIWRGEQ